MPSPPPPSPPPPSPPPSAPPPYPPFAGLYGYVLARALVVSQLKLSSSPESFNTALFQQRLCRSDATALFEKPDGGRGCSPGNIRSFTLESGSTIVGFTIRFVDGGPTIPHMRARLADGIAVQRALGATDFPLADPYEIRLFEDVRHRSNSELMFELYAVQLLSGGSLVFILCGLWAMVILWSITTRGDACRKRFSHSSWLALFMPSAETIQVVVIACFIQLVLCLGFHMFLETGTLSHVISYGIFAGSMGALSISVMNMWIRGESIDLANALSIDKIDKVALGWNEDVPLEDETDEEARAAAVQYCHVYDINPTGRRLGHLAAHDWEAFHKSLEERMGLGMFDLSEQVFDEAKPEKDPGMLAAFLNSKMMSLFGVNKDQAPADAQPKLAPEMHVCAVEVPVGLPRTTLRDALLQWRLRHTAHPTEMLALDWALGQLEPSGFELTAVKVPENLRLVIVEALLAHSQKHAELQLDACHAARLRATLQQLSNRFCDVEVGLPDDCQGTEKVRKLWGRGSICL